MGIRLASSRDNGDRRRVLLPARYMMAILASMGQAAAYGFKVNVSVAIVAMVNHTAIKSNMTNRNSTGSESTCNFEQTIDANATSTVHDGPFVWNDPLQGLILSAYFWSYMLSQIPGGRAAELFSAKWVMNGSIIVKGVACILTPVAVQIHYSLFIILRFAQGLAGGVTVPALHVMIANWAPPNERSLISSIIYSGGALGTVISTLMSGLLAAHFDWSAIFYVEGGLALVWCLAWWFLIQDSPATQTRLITQQEREYIILSLGDNEGNARAKKLPVPWSQIFRSRPFWAILISNVCGHFGWFMLLTELPTFMKQILQLDMKQNATFSALPYLGMWLFTNFFGKVMSSMRNRGWITICASRKIATLVGSSTPMCCLIGVSYVGCNRTLALVLMTLGVTCMGGMFSGALSNHIDIAPNFAGTLVALTNTVAAISGFVVPIFVGKITDGNQTIEAWRKIFFVTVGMYAIDIVAYLSLASADEQPWNNVEKTNDQPAIHPGSFSEIIPLKAKKNYDKYSCDARASSPSDAQGRYSANLLHYA